MASTKRNPQPCSRCRSARRNCDSTGDIDSCTRCIELSLPCDISQLTTDRILRSAARIKTHSATPKPSPAKQVSQLSPSHAPPASQSVTSYEFARLLQDDYYRLVLGLDIGTKFSSACWQILPRDATLGGQSIGTRTIRVDSEHRIPTEAALVLEGHNNVARMVFGPAVQDGLELGTIEDKNVFRLLKLSLGSENETGKAEDLEMMRGVRATHAIALASALTRDVKVARDFEETESIYRISSISDVFSGYLCYLWDKIELDIKEVSNLSGEDLQRVVSPMKTAVSVAVPAFWEPSMIDQLRQLLVGARLPNIHIVSEPKCAAAVIALEEQRRLIQTHAGEIREEALVRLRKIIKIILDIGHGTADLTTCRIQEISPKLRIDTLFMGTGSL